MVTRHFIKEINHLTEAIDLVHHDHQSNSEFKLNLLLQLQ